MARPLTDRQKEVLGFIRKQVSTKGYPPSIREIGKNFGIKSTNGVRGILQALERKGAIKRSPQLSRGIELMHPDAKNAALKASMIRIPIVGSVAAGHPLTAEENVEGFVAVDKDLLKGDNTFALRVKGDSMVGAGIFDKDLVFARQQPTFRRGDIVVAVIGDEATVKYYYPDSSNIRLEPANRFFGPIVVDKSTPGFHIAGKVVGVFRRM
ncbi:repressor LexA [candidate division LCP-89 bacterium B3_LCP]|uniref:LexA repressor n=1 Tax=candidate division LCP-89 bacterium B3_LCP TaxID=2012998 RepID=A0A532V4I4_UNCL8|nr:MAG: repressor LexA [candidate division LCP-89 bacterium B3_LCP]